jgi:hypothetical protein
MTNLRCPPRVLRHCRFRDEALRRKRGKAAGRLRARTCGSDFGLFLGVVAAGLILAIVTAGFILVMVTVMMFFRRSRIILGQRCSQRDTHREPERCYASDKYPHHVLL